MAGYFGSKRSSSLVSATDITLDGAKLKSSGDSITKSDGTTAVLSESSGTVTLTTNTAVVEGSSSGDLVRITQTGSGNALVVEDSANPDNTPFVVDASGNVGVGTNSPSAKLQATTTNNSDIAISAYETTIGGEAKIELAVRNNGFSPIGLARISSVMSSGTVGFEAGDLRFSTKPIGGTLSEQMRIDSSGSLLLGIFTFLLGGERLRVAASGSSQNCAAFTYDSTDDRAMIVSLHAGSSGATSRKHYSFLNSSGFERGYISVNGTSTNFNSASDYRLKENITKINDGISRVKQLNPSRFNFIGNPDNTVDGFIAHEVQGIVPEAVSGEKDAVNEDGKPEYQGVDYGRITPLLTAALKEAIEKIEMLEARIAVLEAK